MRERDRCGRGDVGSGREMEGGRRQAQTTETRREDAQGRRDGKEKCRTHPCICKMLVAFLLPSKTSNLGSVWLGCECENPVVCCEL